MDVDPVQHRETTRVHVVTDRPHVSRDDAFNPVAEGEPGRSCRNIQFFCDGRRNGFGPVAYVTIAIVVYGSRFEKPMGLRTRRGTPWLG